MLPICFDPLKRDTGPEVWGDRRDELRDAVATENWDPREVIADPRALLRD